MRIFATITLPLIWCLSSCSPIREIEAATHRNTSTASVARETEARLDVNSPAVDDQVPAKPAPRQPGFAPVVTRTEFAGISFEGVAFSSNSHRLAVVDQPGGPGSKFADARSAAASIDGLAAANAGFFTPEGAPLGKVISGGKHAGAWNRASSLGAGAFFENPTGDLAIARREKIPGSGQRELLQAGPILIENRRTVTGLNAEKPAIRVFLLWDGGSRWWLGRSSLCTLAELGSALGKASPAGWTHLHALNLDGGRSADLWISGNISGGPLNFRSLFNRPVRNFLVLVPR
jgi:hypothetical protein